MIKHYVGMYLLGAAIMYPLLIIITSAIHHKFWPSKSARSLAAGDAILFMVIAALWLPLLAMVLIVVALVCIGRFAFWIGKKIAGQ